MKYFIIKYEIRILITGKQNNLENLTFFKSLYDSEEIAVAIKNIIKTARLVFIKDFSIRRLPLLEVKSALEKFENEVKDSEEFKTKILEEYYCVVIENQSEK